MASTKAWIDAINKIMPVNYPDLKTTQVYSKIKKMGFNTVEWIELETASSTETEIAALLEKMQKFITKFRPCLFIFDPKKNNFQKGYFVDVNSIEPIKKWVFENKNNLADYFFLITSQISNPGNAIIGSVFSDGKGKMFCETLHLKQGCSHRLLSQPIEDISRCLDCFSVENFELETAKASFLKANDIQQIIKEFCDKKGYFEFVKGNHLNKNSIFVTGLEQSSLFQFPHTLHESLCFQEAKRCNAALLKNS